jgi:hypothetical protein
MVVYIKQGINAGCGVVGSFLISQLLKILHGWTGRANSDFVKLVVLLIVGK